MSNWFKYVHKECWKGRDAMDDTSFKELCLEKINRFIGDIAERNVYIYGASVGGRILNEALISRGVRIQGFIDQRANDGLNEYMGYKCRTIDYVSPDKDYILISLMKYSPDIMRVCLEKGFR